METEKPPEPTQVPLVVVPAEDRDIDIGTISKGGVSAAIALAMEGLGNVGVGDLVRLDSAPTASAEALEGISQKFEAVRQTDQALNGYRAALDALAKASFTNEAFRYSLIRRLRDMMRVGQSIKRLGGDIRPAFEKAMVTFSFILTPDHIVRLIAQSQRERPHIDGCRPSVVIPPLENLVMLLPDAHRVPDSMGGDEYQIAYEVQSAVHSAAEDATQLYAELAVSAHKESVTDVSQQSLSQAHVAAQIERMSMQKVMLGDLRPPEPPCYSARNDLYGNPRVHHVAWATIETGDVVGGIELALRYKCTGVLLKYGEQLATSCERTPENLALISRIISFFNEEQARWPSPNPVIASAKLSIAFALYYLWGGASDDLGMPPLALPETASKPLPDADE